MELMIEHLEDVLPHIQPDTGIIHSNHRDYSVINYVFTVDETFDSAVARECRGLKFAPDGKLIARPFHKFFNLGEKRLPKEEPWELPHVVLDKLDGSMIHPAMVAGDLVFMTRMGMSPQARQAWEASSPEVRDLCRDMLKAGYTPIFEFTSSENRTVVAYTTTLLTLLAVRHTKSGAYMPQQELESVAGRYGVPVAQSFGVVEDLTNFLSNARALAEVEGYVIAFDNGHRLKIKADAYVLRHKALSGLAFEKNLLAWVATNSVDDVLPLLSPEAGDVVRKYQSEVMAGVSRWETEIEGFVVEHAEQSRKDFAIGVQKAFPKGVQSVVFRHLDGTPVRQGLMEILDRAAGSESKVEAIRPLFGMTWEPIDNIE